MLIIKSTGSRMADDGTDRRGKELSKQLKQPDIL